MPVVMQFISPMQAEGLDCVHLGACRLHHLFGECLEAVGHAPVPLSNLIHLRCHPGPELFQLCCDERAGCAGTLRPSPDVIDDTLRLVLQVPAPAFGCAVEVFQLWAAASVQTDLVLTRDTYVSA
jgi:hypothetical protein